MNFYESSSLTMAGEKPLVQVVGQVMTYDGGQWHPAGTSSGLSTVRLIQCPNQTFRIHGQKINEDKEVVLDSLITREVKYNRANDAFIQWHDSNAFWGLNFRRGSTDAERFFSSVIKVLEILNKNAVAAAQVVHQQAGLQPPELTNPQQQQPIPQQQQQSQQNSAAIIQRSLQQQQQQQHMLQQPQQQMMLQQQQQPPVHVLNQPPNQIIHQQPNQQQILQQHQLHQHYIQQQQQRLPPPQSQPADQHQMMGHQQIPQQHIQQQQQIQHQLQQQQQQLQHHHQQQQQQMQQRVAPVAAAPIPPPPPPPPPPPAMNNTRVNGTATNNVNATIPASPANNLQHSPVTNANNLGIDGNSRSGGSPNQTSSLASELAKCQLRKVNVSRSDSDKESECNNNHISNAKTTRAASLANVPTVDNLMNDLSKKLASRRERMDQLGDGQSMSSNNGNSSNGLSQTNGVVGDKVHDSWLADLICKEITKMKAEIIDAIKTELRQR